MTRAEMTPLLTLPVAPSAQKTAKAGVTSELPLQRTLEQDEALRAFALRSAPEFSPRPAGKPMGVEALIKGDEHSRSAANLKAADLIQQTSLTPSDLTALRMYSGEGGLGGSTSAFYTPASLVKVAWTLALELDPRLCRVLEPSCGSGHFFNQAPEGVLLTGVEMDEVSAKVSSTLFPHVSLHQTRFETYHSQSEDGPFDLVIGNPPYGVRGSSAIRDMPQIAQAHWYFTLACLQRLKPGGYLVMVVPDDMTRNKTERALRERLLEFALPLGLFAIPETAFHASGVRFGTVMMVLRRHDAGVSEALEALSADERQSFMQEYLKEDDAARAFLRGEAIFKTDENGNWKFAHHFSALGDKFQPGKDLLKAGRYGDPSYNAPLNTSDMHLETLVKEMRARRNAILTRAQVEAGVATLLSEDAASRVCAAPRRLHAIQQGQLSKCSSYRFLNGRWTYHTALANPATNSALKICRLIVTARRTWAETDVQAALDADQCHLAQFGAYDLKALEQAARQLPILRLLVDTQGQVASLVTEKAAQPPILRGTTIGEIARELEQYGLLDEAHLTQYAQVTEEEARAHLTSDYAFNGKVWEHHTSYYQGHALMKARLAETLAEGQNGLERTALLQQAEELRRRAPFVDITDMHLNPRDALLPLPVLQQWVNEFLGSTVQLKRNKWDTTGEPVETIIVARSEFGVSLRMRQNFDSALTLSARQQVNMASVRRLEAYLNNRTQVQAVANQDVKTTEQIAAERSILQRKAVQFEHQAEGHFRDWLLESDALPEVEQVLNEGRYALLERQMDTSPLFLPAYSGPLAHPFQAGHARNVAKLPGAILNFAGGLGKTLTVLMIAALLKQSGRSRLPTIVMELSRLGDFVMNAATALPGFRVVVLGGTPSRHPDGSFVLNEDGEPVMAEDTGVERRAKVAGLIADLPDLVLATYEAFEAIPMLEETRSDLLSTNPSAMTAVSMSASFDERNRKLTGHKELVDLEKFMQRHLGRVRVARDNDVPFEAIGIDAILADEAHLLKSIWSAPVLYGESSPKFLGGGQESNRALDAAHKFAYVRRQGGLTVASTATWFTNSPIEVYNMLSLVTDDLPKYGVTDIASFIAQFVVIESRLITQPNGEVGYAACVVGFRNLDVLRSIFGQHVIEEDEFSCEMPGGQRGMPLPPMETVEHIFDLPEDVQALYDTHQLNVDEAESSGEHHLFAIFAKLMKLTLHPPLLELDSPNRRFEACVQACLAARARGGQNIIFMYTGGKEGQTYTALREMLIEAGYPAEEIAVVTAQTCPSSSERLRVERRFRRRELSCLIGSRILEKGANLQGGTDLHHMEYPHHHQAFKQRIWRARRQGSEVERIYNHLYFARGSFDVLRYQNMMGKRGWAEQLADRSVINCENANMGFNGEEIAVMLARNPEAMRASIQARKEARQAEARAATLQADLETLRTFLADLKLLQRRDQQARAREHGPSMQDQIGLTRLITRLKPQAQAVQALRDAGHPMAALTRLTIPLLWHAGLPLHVGSRFTLDQQLYVVRELDPTLSTIKVENQSKNKVEYLNLNELENAENPEPTAEDSAYGAEASEALRPALREALFVETPAVTAPLPPAAPHDQAKQNTLSAPQGQATLRFGLAVTRHSTGRTGKRFTVQQGQLREDAQAQGKHLVIEYRPNGEVRQVTMVLPDELEYAQTRQRLLKGDQRLRLRLSSLLSQAA